MLRVFKATCSIGVENTEAAIKNGQSKETRNIDEEKKPKTKHITICVGHNYAQENKMKIQQVSINRF